MAYFSTQGSFVIGEIVASETGEIVAGESDIEADEDFHAAAMNVASSYGSEALST
jgi:predicted regulator of Ras-like GTPase activity (Roadblock/LC7/MglB family)